MTDKRFSLEQLRSDVRAAKASGRTYILTMESAAEVLSAFLAGSICKEDVADWAEFFDVNEDVDLESDTVLPNVLFELASPEINGWPDPDRVRQLKTLLVEPGRDEGEAAS